jgi:pimeloyl-ACP methyl ester carboxylesterase
VTTVYVSEDGRRAVHALCASMLSRWPVPSEQRMVPTRQGDTFVVVCGPSSAPPVVLLQGSGASVAMWMRDIALWARSHRVYAVDLIGEPGFSAASRPPLGSDAYALWLDDVMRALGLVRASFVGVSLGGWIVLDYAMRRADRVERVVILSPSGVGRQRVSFAFKAAGLLLLGRWGRRKAMALAVGPMTGRPHPEDREVGRLALLIARHFRHRRAKVPIFDDEQLKHLTMPLLAIVGARDALLDSHETKRRLERVAPRATVRMLAGAGHVVRDQTPDILEFLNP